jgi:pimeloyl-ACP methyl ester carboxylesterase
MNQSPPQTDATDKDIPGFLKVGSGFSSRKIAYLRRLAKAEGASLPGIVWLGGLKSDMRGTKASYLDRRAAAAGRSLLRFDYSGHGQSEGSFEAATVGIWLEDSLAAIRGLTSGPQILAGSSMGGWLALLIAKAFCESGDVERLKGLVLIAPAVDFTEAMIWEKISAEARKELEKNGVWLRASAYSDTPYPITKRLIEEGRTHLLLGGVIRTHCPVHILQGMQDEDVPWRRATILVEHLAGDPVTLTLVKDGNHRLSREEDLARLWAAIENAA